MSELNEEEVRVRLLQVIRNRIGQLKVISPSEAEKLFLSMVDDTNPIKELLLMQRQRDDYGDIESRLKEYIDAD